MSQTIVSFGQEVTVSELEAETLRSIREADNAAQSAKKGKNRKQGNGKPQHHEDNKPSSDKPAETLTKTNRTISQQLGGTTGAEVLRNLKEQEKEAARKAKEAEANKMATDILSSFHNAELDELIASTMADAEQELSAFEQALKVRERYNLVKLALDTARAQFEKNYSNEYAWIRTMREDLRKNSVAPNSPLAIKVAKVEAYLNDLKAQAVQPLKVSLDESKVEYEDALQYIRDHNEFYWAEKKAH